MGNGLRKGSNLWTRHGAPCYQWHWILQITLPLIPWNRGRGQGLQVGKTEADKGLEETKEVLLPLEAAPSGAGPSDWGIPGPLESWNSVVVWNIPDPSPNSHAGSWRAGPLLGFLGHFCLKPMDLALWSSSRNNQVYGPEKPNSTPNT